MPWEPLPLETDPDAVTARILAGLAARMPGWTAYEGAPEVALAEEVGRETALLAARFVEFVDLAVAGIGATVYGLPPIVATPATLLVDVTVTAPGDVIPDGLTVIGTTIDGHRVAYQARRGAHRKRHGPASNDDRHRARRKRQRHPRRAGSSWYRPRQPPWSPRPPQPGPPEAATPKP